MTDPHLSSSAAYAIAQRARWLVLDSFRDQVLDTTVHVQASSLICPLLSQSQRTPEEIEAEIRTLLLNREKDQRTKYYEGE
jgi:hypothetical protein